MRRRSKNQTNFPYYLYTAFRQFGIDTALPFPISAEILIRYNRVKKGKNKTFYILFILANSAWVCEIDRCLKMIFIQRNTNVAENKAKWQQTQLSRLRPNRLVTVKSIILITAEVGLEKRDVHL